MQHYQGQQNKNRRMQRRQRPDSGKLLLRLTVSAVVVLFLALAAYFSYLVVTLPKVDRLADYKPPIVSQVFGDDGSLVGEFYLERRTVVPVAKIPKKLIQAFVAAEDSNFYQHRGIDYLGVVRAAFKNLISLRQKGGGLHHHPAGGEIDAPHPGKEVFPQAEGGDPGNQDGEERFPRMRSSISI